MSTTFGSELEALLAGLCFIGRHDVDKNTLKAENGKMSQLGFPHECNTKIYNLTNSDDKKVQLGVEPFRSGFCLWLINPDTGMGIRA